MFLQRKRNMTVTVTSQLDKKRAANIKRNRKILRCIIEGLLLCGRQCIALRGDVEKITGPGNPGNFLAILRLIANHNQDLREHLESPAMKNSTMVSPRIQNELLEVMSQHYIIANLVKEVNDVNDAKFFSFMADKVTSASQEVIAVCIRFADKTTTFEKNSKVS